MKICFYCVLYHNWGTCHYSLDYFDYRKKPSAWNGFYMYFKILYIFSIVSYVKCVHKYIQKFH
jgi:hypothetical protein